MAQLHNLLALRDQKEGRTPIRFLEMDEEKSLFAVLGRHSNLYYDFSVFLMDTGATVSEAIRLEWGAIEKDRVTFVETHSTRERTIPLTRRAIRGLDRRAAEPDGPFSSVRANDYRGIWNLAKREAGIDEALAVSVLRHTCAVKLVKGGIDLRTIQKWLGHPSLSMTMRYAQFADDDLGSCVRVLEQQVGQGAKP